MDDSTVIIAAKSGLKRAVLELLEPWYMLDKSYDKSIRESANKGMADGILLERNVRSGNIIIMGLDDAHKRLAVKYSDLFKLKKGDNEILALCHQISAFGYYKAELLDFVKDEGNKLRGVRKE